MLRPSTTSISRAQADGQSCGQVEWRISMLACWFMAKFVTPKYQPAERIYPAMPMRSAQASRAAGSCRGREDRTTTPQAARYSSLDRHCEASTARAPRRYSAVDKNDIREAA